MTRSIVGKWGANLAVRLPRDVVETTGLAMGAPVEIDVTDGVIVIRPTLPRYTLAELLQGTTPEAMREAFDWGPDVGREIVDD